MPEIEIITDSGHHRRWAASEKLRIVEETLDGRSSISVVARRHGVAPNPLHRWRLLMLESEILRDALEKPCPKKPILLARPLPQGR